MFCSIVYRLISHLHGQSVAKNGTVSRNFKIILIQQLHSVTVCHRFFANSYFAVV